MFKRRHKSVTIRLSEEEYETLMHESLSRGAASVSEHARAKLFAATMAGDDVRPLLARLDESLRTLGQVLFAVYSTKLPGAAAEGDDKWVPAGKGLLESPSPSGRRGGNS